MIQPVETGFPSLQKKENYNAQHLPESNEATTERTEFRPIMLIKILSASQRV